MGLAEIRKSPTAFSKQHLEIRAYILRVYLSSVCLPPLDCSLHKDWDFCLSGSLALPVSGTVPGTAQVLTKRP